MARTSVQNTIERIRRQLSSAHRTEVYILGTTVNDTTTAIEITPTTHPGIIDGSEIAVDLELMRVTAAAAGTLTVIRGWLDSDADDHTAGAVVWANSRFSTINIFEAIVDEINSWGPDLYRIVTTEAVTSSDTYMLEADATVFDAYGVVSVRGQRDELLTWVDADYRIQRGGDAWSGADSGIVLRLFEPFLGTLAITWALPFDTVGMGLTTDLRVDVGLADSMMDLLSMGVMMRLLSDDESSLSARDVQDEPRRAEETPLGAATQMMGQKYAIYLRRKNEEISKLRTRYPIRSG